MLSVPVTSKRWWQRNDLAVMQSSSFRGVYNYQHFWCSRNTWWKNAFILPRKYWFVRSVLFNKSVCRGWMLWWVEKQEAVVLASGSRSARICLWDLCVCSPPLALGTALPGRRLQSEAWTDTEWGVPDAESMSSEWQWVSIGKFMDFSRRRKRYPFFLNVLFCFVFPPWCVICFQIIFLFLTAEFFKII